MGDQTEDDGAIGPCLVPAEAHRWVVAAGIDAPFRNLVGLKRALIVAEFSRASELLAELNAAFRADCESFAQLPETARTRVLLDPASVFWIRSTHRAVVKHRQRGLSMTGHSGTADALETQAGQFRDLLLGAAIISNADMERPVRLDESGGLCLPGTSLSFRRIGTPRQSVIVRTRPGTTVASLCASDTRSSLGAESPVTPIRFPQVTFKEATVEINNSDRRFVEEWIPDVEYGGQKAKPIDDEQLDVWASSVRATIALLTEIDPHLAAEATAVVCSLVPVVPPVGSHEVSCSADDFWGASQVSAPRGIALAEQIAHEYRHNILNAIMTFDEVFADGVGQRTIYSPWKGVQRPLVGILHAIYSFQEVLALYMAWLDAHPDDKRCRNAAAVQSAWLEYSLIQLRANAIFTPFGSALFDGLESRVAGLVERTATVVPQLLDLARVQTAKRL